MAVDEAASIQGGKENLRAGARGSASAGCEGRHDPAEGNPSESHKKKGGRFGLSRSISRNFFPGDVQRGQISGKGSHKVKRGLI